MGMQVDDAGRQHHAVGVYGFSRRLRHVPNFDHATVLDGKITFLQRVAEPVGDARVTYYQIVHGLSPLYRHPFASPHRPRNRT